MILSKILEEKRKSVEESKRKLPKDEIINQLPFLSKRRNFKSHIVSPHGITLIAEIKKASPSKGIICQEFDPIKIAELYALAGASALSVLTEEKFFQGSPLFLKAIRNAVALPLLRKDFIIDEYQIYESLYYGADCVLLISEVLSEDELAHFVLLAHKLGMDALVEAHSETELEKAIKAKGVILGINNRDLHTFKVDLSTTEHLISLIPKDRVVVSESGISSHDDVAYLRSLGVNSVLIGETFLKSSDIISKVKEVMGKHI